MAQAKKKALGSVAVDSQTGVETYGVPKHQASTQPSSASPAPGGLTPNYREKADGDVQNPAHVTKEFLNLFEHDPSEVILHQATKHPAGVWFIGAVALLAIILVAGGLGILFGSGEWLGVESFSGNAKSIGTLIAFFLSVVIGLIAWAATVVYRKSRMILTNQKLVFIRYHSLFSREISQLNIGEVEDVNIAQHTIWDRIFKMGTMTIETAGEQNNYVFTHVADAHDFARLTIQAHEGSIAEYGN